MQNCGSDFAPPLSRWISFHGNMRTVRLRGGLREAASLRSFKNAKRVRPGRQSIWGPERKLWHRSEEHTSELQSRLHLVCRLLLEKKKHKNIGHHLNYHSET